MKQQNKSSPSKKRFRQASNFYKAVLEAVKLTYANKAKESITSKKLGSQVFWQIANSVLNKGKSAIPPLLDGPKVLSSASDKAKSFAENFSEHPNLDGSGISLTAFPSRSNMQILSILVTPKSVKKALIKLDLPKPILNYIPKVVLKNCEFELSEIQAGLLKTCV